MHAAVARPRSHHFTHACRRVATGWQVLPARPGDDGARPPQRTTGRQGTRASARGRRRAAHRRLHNARDLRARRHHRRRHHDDPARGRDALVDGGRAPRRAGSHRDDHRPGAGRRRVARTVAGCFTCVPACVHRGDCVRHHRHVTGSLAGGCCCEARVSRTLPIPGGLTPELMRDVGAIMRETMRGVLDLLAARAHAKREVRADMTVIVANDNNPLKFSPDLDAALAHLLVPRGQGFMSPQRSRRRRVRQPARAPARASSRACRPALAVVLGALRSRASWRHACSKLAGRDSILPTNQQGQAVGSLRASCTGRSREDAETDFHFAVRRGIPARVPGENARRQPRDGEATRRPA